MSERAAMLMKTKLRARASLWALMGTYTAISIGSAQPLRSGTGSETAPPVTVALLVDALENNWSGSVKRDSQGHVVTLIVGQQWCNDQNLALVAELNELRQLSLQGRPTNTISANGIRLLRQNTNLYSLTLGCFFTNLTGDILTEVARLPHITQVRLVGAEPAPAEYAILTTMTNLTDLQILYSIHFGDGELARLTNAPSLKSLIVDSRSLSSNSAALLPQFPALTNAELKNWADRTYWKTNWHSGVGRTEHGRAQRSPDSIVVACYPEPLVSAEGQRADEVVRLLLKQHGIHTGPSPSAGHSYNLNVWLEDADQARILIAEAIEKEHLNAHVVY